MALTDQIRPLYRVLKKRAKSAGAVLNSFKYRNSIARSHSSHEYVANLLVVKNPVYAQLAVLCAESFLHHNPKSKVIINADSTTESAVLKAF